MEYLYHDILKEPLSALQLTELAEIAGITVKDLLNPKSAGLKKMALDLDNIDDQQAAALINEQPRIMRRPLLTDGRQIVIGFNAEQYAKLTAN